MEGVEERRILRSHAGDDRDDLASICQVNCLSRTGFLEVSAQVVLQFFDTHMDHRISWELVATS
jgi:hypothetical protein